MRKSIDELMEGLMTYGRTTLVVKLLLRLKIAHKVTMEHSGGRSDGTQVTRAIVETTPIVQFGFFEKINFYLVLSIFLVFHFLGPKILFSAPYILFGLRKLTFLGVINIKCFDLSYGFEL